LGGAIRDEGGIALTINETAITCTFAKLRQDKALAKMIGEAKANSSGWISRTFENMAAFAWQEG